jgi:hypothetical protein
MDTSRLGKLCAYLWMLVLHGSFVKLDVASHSNDIYLQRLAA